MNLKKKIDLLKIRKICTKYPIILFFQHNNYTVADWCILKNKMLQIEDIKLSIIKNSIVQKILLDNNIVSYEKMKNILQGPNFLIGCHNIDQFDYIFKVINSNSNTLFIGGLMENQVINHLDLEKLLQLQNQAVSKNTVLQQVVFTNYQIYLNFIKLVNINLYLNNLTLPAYKFIECLELLKHQKEHVEK